LRQARASLEDRVAARTRELSAKNDEMAAEIEQRRRAEETLRASEEKYRELVENANSIILRMDTEGRITFFNEFAEKFFGYRESDLMGRSVIGSIVPPSDSIGYNLSAMIKDIGKQPERYARNVNENVRRNGERVWIAWTNKPVLTKDGRLVEVLCVGNDITSLKKAEGELRVFHRFAEGAGEGFAIAGLDGRISYMNPALLKMSGETGWSPAEKKSLATLHPREIGNKFQEEIIPVLLEKGQWKGELALLTRDGKRIPTLENFFLIRDDTGVAKHFACLFTDITQQKAVEHELLRAKETAETADRIKSAFLATMSHELRTPLNSIIGFTGILLQGLAGPLNEEQRKQLGMVQLSARHLLALINDVLDISKIEAGQLEVQHELFDLRQSIEKAVQTVAPLAERKGLILQIKVLPTSGQIVGDQRRVEQVLINLLSNAIKFTDAGGVSVGCEVQDRSIAVSVQDTGIGLKREQQQEIFRPFHQVDSGLTRKHEGTGLGLSISKRLVELMGGSIQVTSDYGHGSVFTFTLPLNSETGQ
jgi:PAS domain S-box-containing protein